MANTDSSWNAQFPGIIIRNDSSKNPTFVLTVTEQLNKIASKPIGRLLLTEIANKMIAMPHGWKVVIIRAANTVDITNPEIGKRWHAGNVTLGTDMSKAYTGGTGTTSAIKYNPNVYVTPDGTRPPYIGLAHELIHAHHNLYGTSMNNKHEDEYRVVGMGDYEGEPITENKIRGEHDLEGRTSYLGV